MISSYLILCSIRFKKRKAINIHTCTGWTGLGGQAYMRAIFSMRVSIFSIIFSMLGNLELIVSIFSIG